MADPQEFNSLDELFRKTFDDLPDTPAPSGWDKPSARVWDQVQVRLKPPKGGWSSKTILLIGGMAALLMLGLYWALTRQEVLEPGALTPVVVVDPAPAPEQPATASKPSLPDEEVSTAQVPVRAPHRRQATAPGPATPSPSSEPAITPERETEEPIRIRPAGSPPLPGTNPVSPNTTIRRQMEALHYAPWAKPLAPLPTILESQFIHPVPASLKQLSPSGGNH